MPPGPTQAFITRRAATDSAAIAASSRHAAADAKASSLQAANRAQASSAHAAADAKVSSQAAANRADATINNNNDGGNNIINNNIGDNNDNNNYPVNSGGATVHQIETVIILASTSAGEATPISTVAEETPSSVSLLPERTSLIHSLLPTPLSSFPSTVTSSSTDTELVPSFYPPTTTLFTLPSNIIPETITITSILSVSAGPAAQNLSRTSTALGLEIGLSLAFVFIVLVLAFFLWRRRQKKLIDRVTDSQANIVSIKELEGNEFWTGGPETRHRSRELDGAAWKLELERNWEPVELPP